MPAVRKPRTYSPSKRSKQSIRLTNEIQATIISYVRAGAYDYVAAEAAGISARTFRDWMARGEGRSARASTPKLVAFANQVRQAQAEARMDAEIRVHLQDPARWLMRAAPTRSDREGWDDPSKDLLGTDSGLSRFSDEQLDEQFDRLVVPEIVDRLLRVPPCSKPRCRCEFHKRLDVPTAPGGLHARADVPQPSDDDALRRWDAALKAREEAHPSNGSRGGA